MSSQKRADAATFFFAQCNKLLQEGEKTSFAKHHYKYYKVVAANIMTWLTVIGLIVGLIGGVINKLRGGNFFIFFNTTDSAKVIKKTKKAIHNIAKFFPTKPKVRKTKTSKANHNRPRKLT